MLKSLKNKLISIYLKEYFENRRNLPVTTNELLRDLDFKGIFIEPKTLREYIKALRVYGMDIQIDKSGRNSAYYFQGYKEDNNND